MAINVLNNYGNRVQPNPKRPSDPSKRKRMGQGGASMKQVACQASASEMDAARLPRGQQQIKGKLTGQAWRLSKLKASSDGSNPWSAGFDCGWKWGRVRASPGLLVSLSSQAAASSTNLWLGLASPLEGRCISAGGIDHVGR